MTDLQYQQSIDNMGEYLYNQLVHHADNNDLQSVHAIYSEWVVDGVDPDDEDSHIEFTFLPLIQL